MKTTLKILMCALLTSLIPLTGAAQSFDQLWAETDSLMRRDLPRQAEAAAVRIYDKAEAEGNAPWLMKAWLVRQHLLTQLDPDYTEERMRRLLSWLGRETDVITRAVLSSVIGAEKALSDDSTTEDALRYLHQSLEPADTLYATPAEDFRPMTETGALSGKYLGDSLYDLLVREAIDALSGRSAQEEVYALYSSLLEMYKSHGNRRGAFLTEEARLWYRIDEMSHIRKFALTDEEAEKSLLALVTEYSDVDTAGDALMKLASWYYRKGDLVKTAGTAERGLRHAGKAAAEGFQRYLDAVRRPALEVNLPLLYPGKEVEVQVRYANLEGMTLELYAGEDVKPSEMRRDDAVMRRHFALTPRDDYSAADTVLTVRLPGQGAYTLRQIPDVHEDCAACTNLYISPYQCISVPLDDGRREFTVVDKWSGLPVTDAELVTYKWVDKDYREDQVCPVDSLGRAVAAASSRLFYKVRIVGGKAFMPVESTVAQRTFRDNAGSDTKEMQALFTDRSVYRPGQTVHVSGLAYAKRGDEAWTREGVSMTVKLLQGIKKICDAEGVTDALGVMTCDFALPEDLRPGSYVIKAGDARAAIRVEEYRRPTFHVAFDGCGALYDIGDTVRLYAQALTYSGAPVRNASVRYNVTRRERSWFSFRGGSDERLLSGETVTDGQGRFVVPAVLEEPLYDLGHGAYLAYTVTADVTDLAGETQGAAVTLPAGKRRVALRFTGLPDVLMKEDVPEVKVQAFNMSGVPVRMDILYKVVRDDVVVLSRQAQTGEALALHELEGLEAGRYSMIAECPSAGSAFEAREDFILCSRGSAAMPVDTVFWFHQADRTLYVGSSESDVHLMMNVYNAAGRIRSERISVSGEVKTFTFDDDEDITVAFAFVKHGAVYSRTARLLRPQPERELKLQWFAFRDRLSPGSREEWRLSVSGTDGLPVAANLMATLYDASLDAVRPHRWKFGLPADRFAPAVTVRSLRGMQTASSCSVFPYSHPGSGIDVIYGDYSRLYKPDGYRRRGGMPVLYRTAATAKATAADAGALSYGPGEDESADAQTDALYVRNRIDEGGTAFFFPALRTDDKGGVTVSFTAPETLTEWRMLGFAHTSDMHYGLIEAVTTTARMLMVQPSLPRFLRTGDKAEIVASLVNMSTAALKGKAVIKLIDPETEKTVARTSQAFAVGEGETGSLSFSFTVPDGYDMLIYRIVADAGEYSDGEQSMIPVLGSRETVVETVPLQLHGEETKTVTLDKLFGNGSKTATDCRLKVELTANPAWQVLSALLSDDPGGLQSQEYFRADALSQASAYFMDKLKQEVASAVGRQPDAGISSQALKRLGEMQLADGSWAWYKGMDGSPYITSQIAEMLARLMSRGITLDDDAGRMFARAFDYLTREAGDAFSRLTERGQRLSPDSRLVHYAYICALSGRGGSLCDSISVRLAGRSSELSIRQKAMTAIIMQSVGNNDEAASLVASIKEYALTDEEMGTHFLSPKAEYSWRSYRLPAQVAAMEAVARLAPDAAMLDGMKLWLLKQKQVQGWESSIATADAVYAFVCLGDECPAPDASMTADIDGYVMQTPNDSLGFASHEFTGREANRKVMTVTRHGAGTGWGAVYASYEEDIDKVCPSDGHGLKIVRTYITDGDLRVGDRVTVRLRITADRDMDFIEIADSRPACLEPAERLSGYRYSDGLGYYFAVSDTMTGIYIDKLRRGSYTIDYETVVDRAGEYSMGSATVRSVYAPEYRAYDAGGEAMTVSRH